jgi:hypothetical protein
LLPYFFRYYSSIGATEFACILFYGQKNPAFAELVDYQKQFNLKIYPTASNSLEYDAAIECRTQNEVRLSYASQFSWYCIADLDEFCYFGGKTLPVIAAEAESLGFEAIHGVYVDRLARDGSFPKINGSLDKAFPFGSNLTKCAGLNHRKVPIAKNHVPIRCGHHGTEANLWREQAKVHNFKWYEGIISIIEEKHRRRLSHGVTRTAALLELIKTGGVDLSNPKLRVWKAAHLGV